MEISFFGLTIYGFVAAGWYMGIFWVLSQCTGNMNLFIVVLTLLSCLTSIVIEVERAMKVEREYRNGRP